MQSIDLLVFRFINGWPDFLNPVFISLSEANKWWPVRIFLLLLLAYMIYRKDLRTPAILAPFAAGLANETCDILKATFMMLRPCVELSVLNLRIDKLTSFGTASSHAANMMAIAILFLFYKRNWGYGWLAVAILTGISRVFVGVHYPYQVLYGWIVGALAAGVLIGIERLIFNARQKNSGESVDVPELKESEIS